MKKTTTLSTLISSFREARDQARQRLEKKLWERNDLGNPKLRAGYEMREFEHNLNGTVTVRRELWKRVDEAQCSLTFSVKEKDE